MRHEDSSLNPHAYAAGKSQAVCSHVQLGVLGLETYSPQSGVGRVLYSLIEAWSERVSPLAATFTGSALPLLRNFPTGVHAPTNTDLILLPQLTGAEALRRTRGVTRGVPSVAVVHDLGIVDFPGDNETRDWLSERKVRRSFWGLRFAKHIVSVSEFSRTRLLHFQPQLEERITVIPNGVDETFLSYALPKEAARACLETHLMRPLGAPLLLYVGSEIKRKNMPLLLEVFANIKRQFPRAQLLKVGRAGSAAWRSRTLSLLKQHGLQGGRDVVLLENIDDLTLAHAYRASNAFLSPSLYEGFGLPALEALALGTPTIVTDRGALREVVGAAGWVAKPEAEAFTECVLGALQTSGDASLEHARRARARRFTWSVAANAYLDLFEEAMSNEYAVK